MNRQEGNWPGDQPDRRVTANPVESGIRMNSNLTIGAVISSGAGMS